MDLKGKEHQKMIPAIPPEDYKGSVGKWIVRINGVTSGFVVHTESDNSTIEFGFDASRIEPFIQVGS